MGSDRPLIHLMLSPATLTSQGVDRLDTLRYSPTRSGRDRLTGDALLAAMPELAQFVRVQVDSENPHENATIEDIRKLAQHASTMLARPEIDGLVLVHGTNGLEETAFFLHLTLRTEKPIVVTGAQRPFTALSTDGPANLLDAFRVAAAAEARNAGVLVVANNHIHSARDVTKTSTYRLHTFRSRPLGPLGEVDADAVSIRRRLARSDASGRDPAFDVMSLTALPPVDILYVHAGARGGLVHAAIEGGAEGIVVAGAGAGSTGELRHALAAAAKDGRLAVVRSSRVGEGRVVRDDNWQEHGMVAAGDLNPQKAAILLALGLTRTKDPDEIQKLFDAC